MFYPERYPQPEVRTCREEALQGPKAKGRIVLTVPFLLLTEPK